MFLKNQYFTVLDISFEGVPTRGLEAALNAYLRTAQVRKFHYDF